MSTLVRRFIRALVAPEHRVSCSKSVWKALQRDLVARGGGFRESGAFLLGKRLGARREILSYVLYDDVDPNSLDSGIIRFNGDCYGRLWGLCRERKSTVVADVHTHPMGPAQSVADRVHPMIQEPGHISIILPEYGMGKRWPPLMGLYSYEGTADWADWSNESGKKFYIGWLG